MSSELSPKGWTDHGARPTGHSARNLRLRCFVAVNTPEANARENAAMSPGARGHALWPELVVHATDPVLLKERYSAHPRHVRLRVDAAQPLERHRANRRHADQCLLRQL